MADSSTEKISLVVPMRDEEESICELIASIKGQTRLPDEVILVDGGSADRTAAVARECIGHDPRFRILEIGPASPGKGRNEGIAAATGEVIALTDAGIQLEVDWLARLEEEFVKNKGEGPADIVYGNFHPVRGSVFENLAAFAYVAPIGPEGNRGRSVASCLLRKMVWTEAGGFPDSRAAEDLFFIERVSGSGFRERFAPSAAVHWYLRPDLLSTFRKFVLYSEYNVRAGRQWDWHYGVLKQYLLLVPVLLLALLHSYWWLLLVSIWIFGRAAKRIVSHRFEFGIKPLFNPLVLIGVAGLTLVIDAATYTGWIKAKVMH